LPKRVKEVYDFRNTYVAHEKRELADVAKAREALSLWIQALVALHSAVADAGCRWTLHFEDRPASRR